MTFAFRQSLTTDPTQAGSADSASFPVLVAGTYNGSGGIADLRTVANGGTIQHTVVSNGVTIPADLAFYTDAALTHIMPFEVAAYNATTGAIEAWVQVATLSHTAAVVFYMGYDDVTQTTDLSGFGSGTKPWDANYAAVYHFGDGTTLQLADSTANANTLTNNATATAAAALDAGGGSVQMVAASNQFLDRASPTGIAFADGAALTIEGWIKTNNNAAANVIFSTWNVSTAPGLRFGTTVDTAHVVTLGMLNTTGSAGRVAHGGTTVDDNVARHVMATYDGSGSSAGIKICVNGVLETMTSVLNTSPGVLSNAHMWLGRNGGVSQQYGGIEDEMRLTQGLARSVSWALASYNNQKSGSTFLTNGSQTPVNPTTAKRKFPFGFRAKAASKFYPDWY